MTDLHAMLDPADPWPPMPFTLCGVNGVVVGDDAVTCLGCKAIERPERTGPPPAPPAPEDIPRLLALDDAYVDEGARDALAAGRLRIAHLVEKWRRGRDATADREA